jgi:anti-sigma factor ChrR (cupin superfamily)
MRSSLLFASAIILAWMAGPTAAQDAVEVDPAHHKVEFENDQVRVVRMTYPSRYKAPVHTHGPGVVVVLNGGSSKSWDEKGVESEATAVSTGTVSWSDGGDKHANETVSGGVFELVRVEIKQKAGTPISVPTLDAVKVDPAHHIVDFENDRVRVVKMTYLAGTKVPQHTHLPGVSISFGKAKVKSTDAKGVVTDGEASPGTVTWSDGDDPHANEVIEGIVDLIRVELKTRPSGTSR